MRSIIKTAKTIEEAVEAGIRELNIDRDDADIEIIQEATKGLFGLFGGEDAIVKIKEKEKLSIDVEDIFSDLKTDNKDKLKGKSYKDFSNKEVETIESEIEEEEDFDNSVEINMYKKSDDEAKDKVEEDSDEADFEQDSDDEFDGLYEEGYQPEEEVIEEEQEEKEETIYRSDLEKTLNTRELLFSGEAKEVIDNDSLVEVAEKVKQNLEDLLIKMHIEAKVSYETARDNIINLELSDISENDTGIVIGAKGETLNALQYILSFLTNNKTSNFYRITVNAGNYRDRKKANIENNAKRVAYKVLKTKKPIALKAMNSYERRIVHTALQSYKEIETVSTGKFPNRKVVVRYKGL
ncbi:RNA-binding cell elongation regulator Jag/EloR [uncultured Helcococcus sp.]|uniref:RNA-binding cell elongation regulator Jag/EloR n=1 Tax=uncultured Helcococcus sp. TaxID=1072508 RepID=UPI00262D33B9|nr:RNA-binding cell elongation regulator Jag/EloR [uncultured Helcococcus sp.]